MEISSTNKTSLKISLQSRVSLDSHTKVILQDPAYVHHKDIKMDSGQKEVMARRSVTRDSVSITMTQLFP